MRREGLHVFDDTQIHLCAQHVAHKRITQSLRIAAAQAQPELIVRDAQQMKECAHATLCVEPRAPLPLSNPERGDVAGKLRMRERDGIGAANFNELRRGQGDQHVGVIRCKNSICTCAACSAL